MVIKQIILAAHVKRNIDCFFLKQGSFFRGFLVKRLTNVDKQNVILKVFLGMDFLWPIWGHFEDAATNMLVSMQWHTRINILAPQDIYNIHVPVRRSLFHQIEYYRWFFFSFGVVHLNNIVQQFTLSSVNFACFMHSNVASAYVI